MIDYTNQRIRIKEGDNKGNLIVILIVCLYMIIDLSRHYKIISITQGNILYVLIGLISIIYSIYKNGIKKQIPVFIFMYFYIFFGAIGILFNGNMDIQELLWPFAFMGLANLLLNFKVNYKASKSIYYFVIIFFMVNIILLGGVNNQNTAASRNAISIMVLIYFSIYSISSYRNNKKITLYPILWGLLVNIMAIGRSGILTFVLLAVLFSFLKYDGERYILRNPFGGVFTLTVGIIVLFIFYNLLGDYFADMFSNFQRRGLESVRTLIWADYINKTFTSIKYIVFGTPISGTVLLDDFSQNLHNSFFMLHAKYGIVPLLVIIGLIVNSLIYFIRKKNMLYFGVSI